MTYSGHWLNGKNFGAHLQRRVLVLQLVMDHGILSIILQLVNYQNIKGNGRI
jgi:hypothetical protein